MLFILLSKSSLQGREYQGRSTYRLRKLTVDIKTDGTIHPEEAIKEASRIMIQHLMLITDENITFNDSSSRQDDVVDEHILHMRKLLKTSLEDLDLSVRAYNCLKAAKINTLGEMVRFDMHELLKFRNFGKKSLVEIEELYNRRGLLLVWTFLNINWTRSNRFGPLAD